MRRWHRPATLFALVTLTLSGATVANAATVTPVSPAVVAGYHAVLVLNTNGTVTGLGQNAGGQLGDGTDTPRTSPVTTVGPTGTGKLTQVTALAAGLGHTLAVRADGTLYGWGGDVDGAVGDGKPAPEARPVPTQVIGAGGKGHLDHVVAVAAAGNHSLAVRSDGTVWAWGNNAFGQLGNGTSGPAQLIPAPVVGPNGAGVLDHVVAVATSSSHSVALRDDGSVWHWGVDAPQWTGQGSTPPQPVPSRVLTSTGAPLTGITAISTSAGQTSHALAADGTLWGWGDPGYGKIGDGVELARDYQTTAVKTGLTGVKQVANGWYHTLFAMKDGTVRASGDDYYGVLGLGGSTWTANQGHPTPLTVAGLTGVVAVAANDDTSYALLADGTLRSWGSNENGYLGYPTAREFSTKPGVVVGVKGGGTPALAFLSRPTISGTVAYGRLLTAAPGTWGPEASGIAYQWLRDGTAIAGATKATYRVALADAKHALSVRVTATRAGYPNGSVTSAATGVVPVPKVKNTTAPTISGTAKAGKKLTVSDGEWSPAAEKITRQWLRSGAVIAGATGKSYTLKRADVGHISVRVTAKVSGFQDGVKTVKP